MGKGVCSLSGNMISRRVRVGKRETIRDVQQGTKVPDQLEQFRIFFDIDS